MSRTMACVLGLLFLAGCQSGMVREDGMDGDNAGQLGAAVRRASKADVYIDLAAAYLRENQISEAFKNAKKAVMADEQSARAHNLLGLVYQRLGESGPAEKHYRRALSLSPRDPYILNALGSFLCRQSKFDEANGYFKLAVKNPLYETPWIAYHNAGLCAEKRGNPEKAEGYYRKALQVKPGFSPALMRMVQRSFEKQNYLSSRAYLQRYEQVAEHTAQSLWIGVVTERQLGDLNQMASYTLKLRARFPDSEQARYLNEAK